MKRISFALVFLAVSVRAEMRETKTMADVVPAISTGALLVLDIDNTTLEPVGTIGSDQWYYYLIKAFQRDEGLGPEAAEVRAAATWTRTLPTVKVKPVETITPGFIRDQQKRGIKVMALTARGPEDEDATFAQLKAVDVDYSANPPVKKDLKTANKGVYKRGVFFQGEGPSKGETLLAFIKANGLKPSRVVFVDDKLKHATSVEKVLREGGVSVITFRYGAADPKVNFFNTLMEEAATKAQAELLFRGN